MKLWLDFETYCGTPIKYGTHRYAEDVEIILFAYAIDAGRVQGRPRPMAESIATSGLLLRFPPGPMARYL